MAGRPPVTVARSFLFVPGNRPERFEKAQAADADCVVLDLEDAVAPGSKDAARRHVLTWIERGHQVVVRINDVDSPWYDEDVAALAERATYLMVPKATARAVDRVRSDSDLAVIALIESAPALFEIEQTLSRPGVVRAALGTIDLAADLRVDPDDAWALLHPRSLMVAACATNGLPRPIDGVTTDLRDRGRLASDIATAKRMGFGAKLCIHPAQVDDVNQRFRPSAEEVAWARSVVAEGGGDARAVGGQMVDAPVVRRARDVLAIDDQLGAGTPRRER